MEMDPDKLVEYNPQLAEINPTARIAYAKFKMNLIKQEYEGIRGVSIDEDSILERGTYFKKEIFKLVFFANLKICHFLGSFTPKGSRLGCEDRLQKQDSIIRPRPKSMKLRDSVPGKLKSEGLLSTLQERSKDSPVKEERPDAWTDDSSAIPSTSQAAKFPSKGTAKDAHKKKNEVVLTVEEPPRPLFTKGKPKDGRWL